MGKNNNKEAHGPHCSPGQRYPIFVPDLIYLLCEILDSVFLDNYDFSWLLKFVNKFAHFLLFYKSAKVVHK